MKREQGLKESMAPQDETQSGRGGATLRLAVHKDGSGGSGSGDHPGSKNDQILAGVIDASYKAWLPHLTALLGLYQGDILYIGRAGDGAHAALTATKRPVTVIDPFDPSSLGGDRESSKHGAIVVPGLAFAAWCRNGRKEDFLALLSEQLTAGGLVVADLPGRWLWARAASTGASSDLGAADAAPRVTLKCDADGGVQVLDGSGDAAGASELSGDPWDCVDLGLEEVQELERMLLANGFVESYRTPAPQDGSPARMYAFKGQNRAPLCHPFSPFTVSGTPGRVLVLTEGRGCKVRDAQGKEYIDACGGLWNTHLGLGNAEVIEAMTDQLHRLSYATLFAERGHQSALELATELISLAPYPMQWVSYTGSGSECTEVALRVASYYQVLSGSKEKKRIAFLDESYHGSFAASTCVSGINPFRPLAAGVVPSVALPTPNPDKCPEGMDFEAFAVQCADALEEQAKAGDVAAYIAEPVLASAGVVVPPKAYFERIQAICEQYDIVLILDEVATGFGRTGRWFACEHFDLRPDIVTVAKGINSGYAPLGAVLFSSAIGERYAVGGVPLPHGSTYNGHPICCASALATLKVLRREKLIERAEEVGAFLMDSIAGLCDLESVKGVRGLGLMAAIVLQQADGSPVTPLQIYQIIKKLQGAGVLLYPGPNTLTFSPALVVSRDEIEAITSGVREVLSSVRLSDGTIAPRQPA